MEKLNQNTVTTLKEMAAINAPVGAIYLSEKLSIPQATVGRILFQLEGLNFVQKIGNKGRIVNKNGYEYLRKYEKQTSRIQSVNHLANLYCESCGRPGDRATCNNVKEDFQCLSLTKQTWRKLYPMWG